MEDKVLMEPALWPIDDGPHEPARVQGWQQAWFSLPTRRTQRLRQRISSWFAPFPKGENE